MTTSPDDWPSMLREEDATAALMNTPTWREATAGDREAARQRWLGDEVNDAIEAVQSHEDDPWRAPGTAGHDEEWQRWTDDENRSSDRSDVLER